MKRILQINYKYNRTRPEQEKASLQSDLDYRKRQGDYMASLDCERRWKNSSRNLPVWRWSLSRGLLERTNHCSNKEHVSHKWFRSKNIRHNTWTHKNHSWSCRLTYFTPLLTILGTRMRAKCRCMNKLFHRSKRLIGRRYYDFFCHFSGKERLKEVKWALIIWLS